LDPPRTPAAQAVAAPPTLEASADLPPRFGRFEVRRYLGEGAFGRVYEAYDPSLRRAVALKVAKPEQLGSPERVERFQREARAAATLTHPHIVGVFEAGQDGPHHYIASAFVPGHSLEKALHERSGPLPVREAVELVRKLAEALAYAHRAGVVHRDVKPANVLLRQDGEPLLADFGLATRADEARLTQGEKALGSPGYMAPEQWRGQAGPPSDQYSLGCLFFELLSGQLPFAGMDAGHLMFLHLNEPAPSPRKGRPELPRDVETICVKCLEKEPERRYADCQELADDLRRWLEGEPIRARRLGVAEQVWRWCRRKPLLASATATLALALATVAVLAVLVALAARRDRLRLQQALFEQARAERLAGNRHRALELIAEAARSGSNDDLRQEAIQALTSSGTRFVQEVGAGSDAIHPVLELPGPFEPLPEYAFRFPQLSHGLINLIRGADGSAELVFDGKKLVVLPPHLGLPRKSFLSEDERWLAFRDATEPDQLRLWDCRRRVLHGRLPGCGDLALIGNRTGFLSGIAFSPDGVLLASTHARAGEYVLQLNEIDSKRTLMTRDGLLVAGWSSDGRFLLTSSKLSLVGSAPPRNTVSFQRDPDPGVQIGTKFAQVWEVSCPVPTYQVREPISRLRFRSDGRQLAVNDTLWDVQPANARVALQQTTLVAPGCVLWFRGTEVWGLSPVGKADRDRLARRRGSDPVGEPDILRGTPEVCVLAARVAALVPGPGALPGVGGLFTDLGPTRWDRPRIVGLHPASPEVVLAPPTPPRLVWSVRPESRGITLLCPYRIAWSRDGTKLLVVVMAGREALELDQRRGFNRSKLWNSPECVVEAWDIPSGNRYPLTLPKGAWMDIAWHPEGCRFATAGPRGIQIWDLATSAELVTVSRERADHVVWSDDGRYLLVVRADKKAAVYTEEGRETCAWSALGKDWFAFSLSGEGGYVATGGEDGLIHIWDLAGGREVTRWKAHDAAVTALTFSPDGTLLVSGAEDGAVRVWNLPWIRAELRQLGLDW
jgi:WD40 repeat protein/tRNA A-37 threonylcarbamoyl transferase component Bud32